MATRIWTGVSGDWFSGAWFGGEPGSGDTALLEGSVTITPADAAIPGQGSLDGISIAFAAGSGASPVLDAADMRFGPGMVIATPYAGDAARFIARGTTGFAGTLDAHYTDNSLTLDLEDSAGIAAAFVNAGLLEADYGTLAVVGTTDAVLTNAAGATIAAIDGGTIDIAPALVNDGLIAAEAGTIAATGSIGGAGTILVGDHVTLDGPVGAGQVVSFGSATDATLDLGDPGAFAGTITGLTGHDVIHLDAPATAATYDAATGTLAVLNGGSTIARLAIGGGATSLNVIADGMGGAVLTAQQIGTPSQVETYMVQNQADTFNGHQPLTHVWPTPNATVYYTFEPGGTLTAADESAFRQGMALYQDIANISFATADASHPADLFITTDNAGTAGTFYTVDVTGSTDITTSATINIDTTVPSWSDLADFGTKDTSGFGGYGFLTVLHELGHAIGFGHPGPYDDNGTATNFLNSQIFYTDTRQYTVMSYIDAAQSGANWQVGQTTIMPQTPMMYDIAAAQMIYGANTSVLAGNDTFGFNASFAAGTPLSVYNFAVNTNPVVTLYDAGQNNTLDLSGFSSASYVNLNPGSFSSTDGLTDNIGIAATTTIDAAVGGAGNDVFTLNGFADTIDGGGGTNTVVLNAPAADFALAAHSGTVTVTDSLTGVADTLTNIQVLDFLAPGSPSGYAAEAPPCFLRGTRVLTTRGEIPVEALRPGEDHAVTRDGRCAPVVWVGWRGLDPAHHPRPGDVLPVRVSAGALAPGQPARDLLLSPDHALALDGALIPVRHLLNGATIVQEPAAGRIVYFHVELDRHDILLAEGAAAESYLDAGNRGAFTNAGTAVHLHPRFAPDAAAALRIWRACGCAPLLTAGPALLAARAALTARALEFGYRLTRRPALHALADGRALPLRPCGRGWHAAVLPSARALRLLSRAAAPLHLSGPGGDPRRLGIAVAALLLDGRRLALDDARLGSGWHTPERAWRWTDGAAEIEVRYARSLALRIAMSGSYWLPPRAAAPRQSRTR